MICEEIQVSCSENVAEHGHWNGHLIKQQ